MSKIVVGLLLAALALLLAQLIHDAPVIRIRVGELVGVTASAPVMPPLMYAGIRG